MKRSEINEILLQADEMMRRFGFALPPFAYWTPDEFAAKAADARHVIDARCGWDRWACSCSPCATVFCPT